MAASFTLTALNRFPQGTSVGVYAATDVPSTSGPPAGTAVETQTMGATGATFTTLTTDGRYAAYAQVGEEHRYVLFVAGEDDSTPGFVTEVEFGQQALIRTPASSSRNVIQPSDPTVTPMTLRQAAGQSAPLLDFQDSNQNSLGILGSVTPEDHGAKGDGTTDDYAALNLALATGKAVSLTPGKTYLCRRQLILTTDGQRIYGNGASIKRPAQGVTTTTTTISSGVTSSITVASASGFRVGDPIVIEKSGSFDASTRTISSIVGSVITISGTFGISSSGTTNVRTGYYQLGVSADDVRISDLTLDGNSANWSWGRWQHTGAIISSALSDSTRANALTVDHCHIKDTYGDGIAPGGEGTVLAFNWIENIAGRGISFSGFAGSPTDIGNRCIGNHVLTCNTDTAVGGSDGFGSINFSQGGPNTLIEGNYIKTGYDGIYASVPQNSGINLIANEIHSITRYGVLAEVTTTTTPATSITIRDNEIDTTGDRGIQVECDANSGVTALKRLSILNNELRANTGTAIKVTCFNSARWISDVKINDNTVYGSAITQKLIHAHHIKNLTIRGNHLNDGQYGVIIDNVVTDGLISHNICKGQYTNGIVISDTASTGVQVAHNRTLSGTTIDTANYYGILLASGDALDNYIDVQLGSANQGLGVQGASQLIKNNRIVRGANTSAACITVTSAATSPTLALNNVDGPINVNSSATGVVQNSTGATLDRTRGLPGLIVPEHWSAVSTQVLATANRAYYVRFVPSRDMVITKIGFVTTVAATNNDACDVGLFTAALAKITTAGATSGKLNATAGPQAITITTTTLTAGTVYYAAFSVGTIGGTGATLVAVPNPTACLFHEAFGATAPNLLHGRMETAHPLPDPLTYAGGVVVGGTPMLFIRES